MINETVDLYEYFGVPRGENAGGILTSYVPYATHEVSAKKRPAMIVFPGGGYWMLSDREKEPVALRFLSKGYSAFTLQYAVHTAYPVPLVEACMAVAYIRENAEKYSVDEEHIAAVGFSAGGHLAAMLATLFAEKEVKAVLGERNARPDAVILSYPVITADPRFWHEGSIRTISGEDEKLAERLSAEKRVTKNSVPAFIWHTAEDDGVPVENALLMAQAYRAAGVPFELHIFQNGCHGLSLANEETANGRDDTRLIVPNVAQWVDLSLNWLALRGFLVR